MFRLGRARPPARTTPRAVGVGYAGRRWPPEVLTPGEVRALIAASPQHTPTGLRNRALITVMYRGGLRVSEALALLPRDVDLDAGTVYVRHGKGDRSRRVGIDAGAAAVVAAWLRTRGELGFPRDVPLFCSMHGRRLATSYVRTMLPRLGREAGIDKRVHAHAFRHTHAAELCQEGVPIDVIRDQLGHSSLATTDRYLRHIAPQRRLATMRARAWTP